ncbi:metal-dependent phosphohydrolase [Rubrobacter xylanophilus]|uniref:Metal-dependent phosphohydrolase n=2 Tax=Rubrobacter xylanophilus TaxID=49319 RepID=A0A510HED0_9ACTN|nr:metal-dependent phosphohydrolase [Rubrobacter xylanophilus]
MMPGSLRVDAARLYIFGLSGLAFALLGGWIYLFGVRFSWFALGMSAVLSIMCAVSRRFRLSFGRNEVEVGDVATLAALAVAGPVWALLVAAPAVLYRDRLRMLYEAATYIIILVAAGLALWLSGASSVMDAKPGPELAYGIFAAGAAYYSLDALINSLLARIKYGTPVVHTLRESMLPLIPSDIAAVITAAGVAYAVAVFGPATALVLFSGAFAALMTLHMIHERQRESEELREENRGLREANAVFAARLIETVGLRDGYTHRHAAAAAVYTEDVAREFGLEQEKVQALKTAALLQNVGLAGIPDEVLLSPPGKLNSLGKMQLEQHPMHGERLISGIPGLEEAAKWVRWHHERVDGSGYPDRIRGEWLPVEARILAATGLYAEMVLDGPHSPALPAQEARFRLTSEAGKGLDPEVVKVLLRVLDREDGNYATASDDRFAFPEPSEVRRDEKAG